MTGFLKNMLQGTPGPQGPAAPETGVNQSRFIRIFLCVSVLIVVAVYYRLFSLKSVFYHDSIMWYGIVHYFVDSLAHGNFPYWDPYMITGTYFYPNISMHGLLDPVVLVGALMVKFFGISPLTVYVYFRLVRLVVYVVGVYYLFSHATRCRASAFLGACMVLFSVIPTYFGAYGMVDIIFLAPYVLCFLLKFLEDPDGPKRHIYILGIACLTGLSMNFYIPSYCLFNLIVFAVVTPVLRSVDFPAAFRAFRSRKLFGFSAASVLLMVMIAAPPLTVAFKDASGSGELFPMLRIVQKNSGNFKQILATEIATPSLSAKFTDERGIFNSYGNLVQLLYADSYESVPVSAGSMGEAGMYIGILPFAFAVIGLLYSRSRYRYFALVMMGVIFLNMFSFDGMAARYNPVQRFFNAVFPFLKMIETRQGFGVFFVMYLSLLASLGFSVLLKTERLSEKYRGVMAVCAVLLLVKLAVTFKYGANRVVYSSFLDLFLLIELAGFAAFAYLHAKGRLAKAAFLYVVAALVFIDFALFCRYNVKYVLMDSTQFYQMAESGSAKKQEDFQAYRDPLPAPMNVAFAEGMMKSKGALAYPNNHTLFTTKRYYDYLTHVPLQNQMELSGVVQPVLKFFPADNAAWARDRREILSYFSRAEAGDVSSGLFLEDPAAHGADQGVREFELRDFRSYPDAVWLNPENVFSFFEEFGQAEKARIQNLRRDPGSFLNGPGYSLEVAGFSPNELAVRVQNSASGYLYYNDGWSRYWRAFDGKQELPVLVANYNSKAVFLESGSHSVRFVFDPRHYKLGLLLHYIGLATAVLLFFCLRRRSGAA